MQTRAENELTGLNWRQVIEQSDKNRKATHNTEKNKVNEAGVVINACQKQIHRYNKICSYICKIGLYIAIKNLNVFIVL